MLTAADLAEGSTPGGPNAWMERVTVSSMKGGGRGGGVGARSELCGEDRVREEWMDEARRLKSRRWRAALIQC